MHMIYITWCICIENVLLLELNFCWAELSSVLFYHPTEHLGAHPNKAPLSQVGQHMFNIGHHTNPSSMQRESWINSVAAFLSVHYNYHTTNLTIHTLYYRSLVALSLILSMLLFKPAPLYILDEVDAALDLSHTQNIGQMLRTHFRHSQVSINKDYMIM